MKQCVKVLTLPSFSMDQLLMRSYDAEELAFLNFVDVVDKNSRRGMDAICLKH